MAFSASFFFSCTNTNTFNKPMLDRQLEATRKSQEEAQIRNIVLKGEEACAKGYNNFISWYKTVNDKDRKLIADKMEHFKSKCEEADNINQDGEK